MDGTRFLGFNITVERTKGEKRANTNPDGSKSRECFNCGRIGHYAKECRSGGGRHRDDRDRRDYRRDYRRDDRRDYRRDDRRDDRREDRSDDRYGRDRDRNSRSPVRRDSRSRSRSRSPIRRRSVSPRRYLNSKSRPII